MKKEKKGDSGKAESMENREVKGESVKEKSREEVQL